MAISVVVSVARAALALAREPALFDRILAW
jgi:hypothetical protein